MTFLFISYVPAQETHGPFNYAPAIHFLYGKNASAALGGTMTELEGTNMSCGVAPGGIDRCSAQVEHAFLSINETKFANGTFAIVFGLENIGKSNITLWGADIETNSSSGYHDFIPILGGCSGNSTTSSAEVIVSNDVTTTVAAEYQFVCSGTANQSSSIVVTPGQSFSAYTLASAQQLTNLGSIEGFAMYGSYMISTNYKPPFIPA